MTKQIFLLLAALGFCSAAPSAIKSTPAVSAAAIINDSTNKTDSDLKTATESLPAKRDRKLTTPNTSSEGVAERKGQTDPSGPHSYIGSRARGKSLQTDKFPRRDMTSSGTTRSKN